MNIGIVTSHASFKNNYGAVLQCYAMCEQLKRWGITPHVINYAYTSLNGEIDISNSNHHTFISRIKYILSSDVNLIAKVQYRINRKHRKLLEGKFVNFYQNYIPLTPKTSITYDELKKNGLGFDGYITGSDQVWNPLIHGNKNDPCCFLQFAEPGTKRIAYAPSFGISFLPNYCKESLMHYINTFNSVSVREISGQKILHDIVDEEFPVVLDPTLMADPDIYDQICEKNKSLPEHYILCYRFGKMKYFDVVLKKISRKMNVPVIELPLSIEAYAKGTRKDYSIGPAEFIGAIKGADLILTDSFHCTVFSILNKKPFYSFLRQNKSDKNSMNGRIEDLLQTLKLENRLIRSLEDFEKTSVSLNMDYSYAYEIIDEKRKASQTFLKNALFNK